MQKYTGPAKALKRVGAVAECHTEDHEDVAESRVATTRRAIAFALALRLPLNETAELLESAGFSLSQFYLEDIIVKSCITAGIYEIDRVNSILAAHGAKMLSAS